MYGTHELKQANYEIIGYFSPLGECVYFVVLFCFVFLEKLKKVIYTEVPSRETPLLEDHLSRDHIYHAKNIVFAVKHTTIVRPPLS